MDYEQIAAQSGGAVLDQAGKTNLALGVLFAVACLIILLGMILDFVRFIDGFAQELRYLNMEIRRTEEMERNYYIARRRRLWLSLLPFVRY